MTYKNTYMYHDDMSKIDLIKFEKGFRVSVVSDVRDAFELYVKKIFISRVCKCVTRNVFTMYRKKIYPSVCEENPRYTFLTIKSSLRSYTNA